MTSLKEFIIWQWIDEEIAAAAGHKKLHLQLYTISRFIYLRPYFSLNFLKNKEDKREKKVLNIINTICETLLAYSKVYLIALENILF